MTIDETSIAHGGEDLGDAPRGSANLPGQLDGAMKTVGLEKQGDGDVQPGRGEEIGDPYRFGFDEGRDVGVDANGLAAQLEVAPSIQPGHPALGQYLPGRGRDPVRHDHPPGELTGEPFGFGLAHAPARLHGNVTLVGLHHSVR
jgi:hypothetical protein